MKSTDLWAYENRIPSFGPSCRGGWSLSQEEVLSQCDVLYITSDWESLGSKPTYFALFPYASLVVPIHTSLRAVAVKNLFLFFVR